MQLSLAGLLEAALFLAIGLLNYRIVVSALEKRLRALDRSATTEEQSAFEQKLGLMRRIILWTDIVVFPVIGYTLGRMVGG